MSEESLYRLEFRRRPELTTLVAIVIASGDSLATFLSHHPRAAKRVGRWHPFRVSRRLALPLLSNDIEAELRKPVDQRLSAAAMARNLGISASALMSGGGEAARRLVDERRVHRTQARLHRRADDSQLIAQAVVELSREGKRPTIARVEARIGRHGLYLDASMRRSLRAARMSLGRG